MLKKKLYQSKKKLYTECMNDRKWGGYRVGAGRKATGRNTVNITLTLLKQECQILKQRAESEKLSVSRYIAKYLNLKTDELPETAQGGETT